MITDPEKIDKNDFSPNFIYISGNKCISVVKSVSCLLGSISAN
jgi:hypothetical protein